MNDRTTSAWDWDTPDDGAAAEGGRAATRAERLLARLAALSSLSSFCASVWASEQAFGTALRRGVSARLRGASEDAATERLATLCRERSEAQARWRRLFDDPRCVRSNREFWSAMLKARTAYTDATLALCAEERRQEEQWEEQRGGP